MLLAEHEERSIEASPARRARAIEEGHGPRAPWLASALTGLLALGLLSLAAGPVAAGAASWVRGSLSVQVPQAVASDWRAVLWPAVVAALAVLAAAIGGQALAHGGWTRLGPWRRGRRASIAARLRSASAGWLLGFVALAGGVSGALPWIGALPGIVQRPLAEAAWGATLFVVSAGLGALLAVLAMGFLQLRHAMHAFERTLRMTRSEAMREDREHAPRARGLHRGGWRFA